MSFHHLRVVRTLLAAIALQGAAWACVAQDDVSRTVRVTARSADPGGYLSLIADGGSTATFENGRWYVDGAPRLLLSWTPSPANTGLGTLDLQFDFQPWHRPLDAQWELVYTAHPDGLVMYTTSRFVAAPGAQLATARGLDRWDVTEAGGGHFSFEAHPLPAGTLISTPGLVWAPWTAAPKGTGSWDLSLTQTLIGSHHLLASSDPDCLGLACMPGQRAAVSLDALEFYLPVGVEVHRIAASVPEPQVPALLAAGLGVIAWLRGRRGARVRRRLPRTLIAVPWLACGMAAQAQSLMVSIHDVNARGMGQWIGHVRLTHTPEGLRVEPNLFGLPPGPHGFHVHEHPNCSAAAKDGQPVAALAAGGHLDPAHSGHHAGPDGAGHLGDLPVLVADAEGRATQVLLAPRLRLTDVLNRSLMIHAGGDNHSDQPAPSGGGGARIACGVIEVPKELALTP